MKKLQKLSLTAAVLALMLGASPAFAADAAKDDAAKTEKSDKKPTKAQEIAESEWTKRCNEKDKKSCEVFKILVEKNSKARIVEMAFGYPKDDSKLKKGTVRAGVILPLGIVLETGVGLQIDDGKLMTFPPHYCLSTGCYALVNIEKDILDTMKKGKTLNLFVKSLDGQNVRFVMNLKGLEEALKSVE